jgi:hypothetical protein
MAGGMFRDEATEGPFTSTSIESYWIAFGLTWRFDAPLSKSGESAITCGPACAN